VSSDTKIPLTEGQKQILEEIPVWPGNVMQFLRAGGVTKARQTSQSEGGGVNPAPALQLKPTTLRKANDFVAQHHRHNGRTSRNGGRWACSVEFGDQLVGVAIVGNPLSATYMDGYTAEILRVCTSPDAPRGACSMLYAACWRAWKAMGGRRMITYTLTTETGASLRGAGWRITGETKPCAPGWRKNDDCNESRTFQPVMALVKRRWEPCL